MDFHSVVLGILAFVTALFVYHVTKLLRSPLRTIPSPLPARFTDAWYFWNVRKGSFEKVNRELHKRYGT